MTTPQIDAVDDMRRSKPLTPWNAGAKYIIGRKSTSSRIGTLYERIGESDTMEEVATGDVSELRKLAARLNADAGG